MAKDLTTETSSLRDNGRSGFALYESVRIIIPGLYFVSLTFLLYWSFFCNFLPSHLSGFPLWLLFFLTALVIGLTMYAKETPKRRKAFQDNQPSRYLSSKAKSMKDIPLLNNEEAKQIYFFLLNNHMPTTFHEKVFFFGTIYHIMIQVRRTSFWFALLAILLIASQFVFALEAHLYKDLLVFALGVWIVYLLNVQYNKADRKMQENYSDQIFWLRMNNRLVEEILRRWATVPKVF